MSGRVAKTQPPVSDEQEAQAIQDFTTRWMQALGCLRENDKPQWQRTQDALMAFKGLPLDALPPKLLQRIDRCFARVNAVLAGYAIVTWDDYAKVSPEDLTKIGKLIHEIV